MKEFVALDIGFCYIKVMVAGMKGSRIVIKKTLMIPTPENTIEDGKILAVETVAQSIKEQLSANKIKQKDTVITINGTSVISREVIMPKAKEKELKNIINMQAEQYFPVSLENYVVDFKVLEEVEMPDQKKQYKVLLVAIPSDMIDRYVDLVKACDLNPIRIDFYGNSIAKIVNHEIFTLRRKPKKQAKKKANHQKNNLNSLATRLLEKETRQEEIEKPIDTVAIIDMGGKTTTVSIISKGVLQFSRIILYGGSSITASISERLQIPYEEAEKQKEHISKVIATDKEALEKEEASQIDTAIKSIALILIDDIIKYFEFYHSRNGGNKIERVYMVGGSSNIYEIERYLGNAFNIPTLKLDYFQTTKFKDTNNKTDLKYYLGCLGAVMNNQ